MYNINMIRSLFVDTNAELGSAVSASYTPTPIVRKVQDVYDIKSWLSNCIEEIHGHTQPLHFKFVLNEDEKAAMYYRQWCSDAWSKDGFILLKV